MIAILIVSVSYPAANFTDASLDAAAGREPETTTFDGDHRQKEWHCTSQFEADRIRIALKKIGLIATVQLEAGPCPSSALTA